MKQAMYMTHAHTFFGNERGINFSAGTGDLINGVFEQLFQADSEFSLESSDHLILIDITQTKRSGIIPSSEELLDRIGFPQESRATIASSGFQALEHARGLLEHSNVKRVILVGVDKITDFPDTEWNSMTSEDSSFQRSLGLLQSTDHLALAVLQIQMLRKYDRTIEDLRESSIPMFGKDFSELLTGVSRGSIRSIQDYASLVVLTGAPNHRGSSVRVSTNASAYRSRLSLDDVIEGVRAQLRALSISKEERLECDARRWFDTWILAHSMNHLDDPLDPLRMRTSHLSHLCGLSPSASLLQMLTALSKSLRENAERSATIITFRDRYRSTEAVRLEVMR